MLKIENVTKSYSKKANVLEKINLTIKKGTIFGFVGHNGAGKTTLIKAIVGIHGIDQGKISINNFDIAKEPIACKKIMAYIPDNPDVYLSLTGIEYLNFIADVYEMSIDARTKQISKYAKSLDLQDVLTDVIASYSHGMKQKLMLISAFMHEPKLIILDEPFVGLDPSASYTLKNLMKDLCANGSTIFLSSHVLEVVEKLCDEIAIIKEGQIMTSGITKKVLGDKNLETLFLELNHD